MKKQLLFLLFCVSISFNGWSQITINGFVTNPVEQGKNVTANITYTASNTTDYFYVGLFRRNSIGGWLQTIVESSGNQFLVPSTGTNIADQITLAIPLATVPTASLTNGEYYDIYIEQWTANWGVKLGSSLSSKLTIATTGTLGVDTRSFVRKFVLYPNPVNDILNIKNADDVEIQSLKITNIVGKTVYTDFNTRSQKSIDVSNLSSGIYIISVETANGILQSKFMK